MDDETTKEQELLDKLIALLREFQQTKPQERSELARRYAVTITELERCAAYFASFCAGDLLGR